jgi:hypothetical protein
VTFSEEGKGSGGKIVGIGGFRSYDWFGDASFYLLNTPGHTVDHLSALARTTAMGSGNGDGNRTDESTFHFHGRPPSAPSPSSSACLETAISSKSLS